MENIQVIPYSGQYFSEAAAMIVQIQQNEFGIDISLEEQEDLLNIEAFYQKDKGNFWVAVNNSQIVGTVGLLDIGSGMGALRKMFVRQNFRSKEPGIAHRLLCSLLDWSCVKGFDVIYLGTTDKFKAAHRFYEKNGFTRITANALPAAFPRMRVDSIFYMMVLSEQHSAALA